MKIAVAFLVSIIFLAGLTGVACAIWWIVQSDWYDKGMMDK